MDELIGYLRVLSVLALFAFAVGSLITNEGRDIVIMFAVVLIAFEQVLQTNAHINARNQ